jgi:hypothetical protein
VIEGTCRYLVADLMDITGARWSVKGAEAVLMTPWKAAVRARPTSEIFRAGMPSWLASSWRSTLSLASWLWGGRRRNGSALGDHRGETVPGSPAAGVITSAVAITVPA